MCFEDAVSKQEELCMKHSKVYAHTRCTCSCEHPCVQSKIQKRNTFAQKHLFKSGFKTESIQDFEDTEEELSCQEADLTSQENNTYPQATVGNTSLDGEQAQSTGSLEEAVSHIDFMNFACADWDKLIEAEKDEESLKSFKTPSKPSKADNVPCKREAKAARKQSEDNSCMSFAAYCEASAEEHKLTQHLLESHEPVDQLTAAIDIDALMQKPVKTSPKKRVKRAKLLCSQTLGSKRSFSINRFDEPEPVATKRPCQVANIDKAFGASCCHNKTCC